MRIKKFGEDNFELIMTQKECEDLVDRLKDNLDNYGQKRIKCSLYSAYSDDNESNDECDEECCTSCDTMNYDTKNDNAGCDCCGDADRITGSKYCHDCCEHICDVCDEYLVDCMCCDVCHTFDCCCCLACGEPSISCSCYNSDNCDQENVNQSLSNMNAFDRAKLFNK